MEATNLGLKYQTEEMKNIFLKEEKLKHTDILVGVI